MQPSAPTKISKSPFRGKYDKRVDRESAYEMLAARTDKERAASEAAKPALPEAKTPHGRTRQSAAEAMMSSAARAIGSSLGRQLIRGILGSLLKKR